MEKVFPKLQDEPWRVLEFYSGIGGMRYSLLSAGIHAKVVQAFDINDKANDVYEHNFGDRPYQGNIESLTAADIDSYQAHVWLLSPPCQPYTRQGLQKQSGDARAFSFLKILELMVEASRPPVMLFMENVVGFETSDTHTKMIEILEKTGFSTQEFILSPMQFGVPYSRPRYFCLAKRKPLFFEKELYNNQLLWSPNPLLDSDANLESIETHGSQATSDKLLLSCEPICRFLDHSNHQELSFYDASSIQSEVALEKNKDADEQVIEPFNQYLVPSSLIDRWGSAMGDAAVSQKATTDMLRAQARFWHLLRLKGWARLILLKSRSSDILLLERKQTVNYQISDGFDNSSLISWVRFHEMKIQVIRNYALLGNSLSIAVVAPLLRYLFTEPS
ncbi:hypothetical protein Csa_022276 [Cucumis sativus]|nr:hypothetical protein Csa_022276 [Cucumis sativus]